MNSDRGVSLLGILGISRTGLSGVSCSFLNKLTVSQLMHNSEYWRMVREGMSSWKLDGKLSLSPVSESVSKRSRLPLAVTMAKEGTGCFGLPMRYPSTESSAVIRAGGFGPSVVETGQFNRNMFTVCDFGSRTNSPGRPEMD